MTSPAVQLIGLGGSLRRGSTSLGALETALEGSAAAGAEPRLIWVRDLDLPLYNAELAVPPAAQEFADTVYACGAMIWSTPTYHGSISGSFKNALDWLIVLAERDPPYLANKPIGLISTAGGVQGLQSVNSMSFIARALRVERSARAAGCGVMAILHSRRTTRRRGGGRAVACARRGGRPGGAAVPGRRHQRLRGGPPGTAPGVRYQAAGE